MNLAPNNSYWTEIWFSKIFEHCWGGHWGGWVWQRQYTYGRRPLVKDNLWWKTTFGGRRPLVEDDLWWNTTFGGKNVHTWKEPPPIHIRTTSCVSKNVHTLLHIPLCGIFLYCPHSREPVNIQFNQPTNTDSIFNIALYHPDMRFFNLTFHQPKFDMIIALHS